MKIDDMLSDVEIGQRYSVELEFDIGEEDYFALKALAYLYDMLPEDATFEQAQNILVEAIWWNTTYNVLADIHNAKN